MPKHLHLNVTEPQRQELTWHRDHAQQPYLRERCAALLMIAEGDSPAHVARTRLYKRREPDTLYRWYHRYQQAGVAGLRVQTGRGRKPAFFPRWQNAEQAKAALLHLVRRDPHQFGVERSRWTLGHLLACCRGLRLHSRSGLWCLLHRLGIHYKRGRSYIHSPDPAYDEKVARIEALKQRVQAHPEEVLLYQDECTLHRQPSVAPAYEQAGSDRTPAHQSTQFNTVMRVVGLQRAGHLQELGENRDEAIERLLSSGAGQLSDGEAYLAYPR